MATPSFLGTRRNGYRSGSTCRSAHFGKLDVVINNAGYTLVGTVEEASEADIRALFDTNYLVRSGSWPCQKNVLVGRCQNQPSR